MNKNKEYAERYAEEAKEQMRRYGIPASVILAQGILESSNGQSELSRLGNNHFGIKATASWLNSGGEYLVYTDDRPDEKFCKYASVGDSYEHHSQFLRNNKRYAQCFTLSPDDYKGWTQGIERAGYATGGNYARNLQRIIEANGLDRYDKEVMDEMRAQGRSFGTEANPRQTINANASASTANTVSTSISSSDYSFPLKRDEFLFITSPFGMRQDPMDKTKQQMHKGIDIRCDNEALFATESNGKVVAVNDNANTAGGKSVTVEYAREEGSKTQVSYLHLNSVSVNVGDTVNAGQQIAVSGNTGTRTTGPHLHLGVVQVTADGGKRDIDPAAYLAEIAQKGNISLMAMYNGQDLLAKYKTTNPDSPSVDTSLTPDEWMKKLLSSEDSGIGLGGASQDPVMELAMTLFSSLLVLATQIDNKTEEERMTAATEAAITKQVDLKSLTPDLKQCTLTVRDNASPMLHINNQDSEYNIELSVQDVRRLSSTLNDGSLTEAQKRQRVASIINNIVMSAQMSQSYQQGIQQSQEQNISLK